MKRANKSAAVEVRHTPGPGTSMWRKLGITAFTVACIAVAIYAFKVGTGQTSESRTKDTAADQNSHGAGHHTATVPTTPDAASAAAKINDTPPPSPPPDGMVWVPGGTFWMGCVDCDMPDAQPVHLVAVDGFWMDQTPITNRQFEQFVKATAYVTVAERKPDPKDYPGAPPESLVAGSAVFTPPPQDVALDNYFQWWRYVPGASWRHPEGPGSTTKGREDHPAVHIAWEDAAEYVKWTGKRLPTEAEYEFAARGGLDRHAYAWGRELKPGGKWAANIWQGRFPSKNVNEDGYINTSPVKAFAPNGYGLYDMGGNVWQWCADWYRPDYFATLATTGTATHDPHGPLESYDPQEPGIQKRVQKGGSFLCSDEYCTRYLVGSRGKGAADSGSSNVGFRCVKSPTS